MVIFIVYLIVIAFFSPFFTAIGCQRADAVPAKRTNFYKKKALVAFITLKWTTQKSKDKKSSVWKLKNERKDQQKREHTIEEHWNSVCSTDHVLNVSHVVCVYFVTVPIICFNHRHYHAPFRIHNASATRHVFISTSSRILLDCFCLSQRTTTTMMETTEKTRISNSIARFAKLNQEHYVSTMRITFFPVR